MIIWLSMAESAWSEVQSSVGLIYLIFSVPAIKCQVSAVANTLLSCSAHWQDSVLPSGWKGSMFNGTMWTAQVYVSTTLNKETAVIGTQVMMWK